MKCLLVLLVFCSFIVNFAQSKLISKRHGPPPETTSTSNVIRAATPEWHTITQWVDHFNPNDMRTWNMRYISNDVFYEDGGPIFIYLGGEWIISEGRVLTGQMYDMANIHKGYMFYTEHRYYGESYPTEDMSTKNLKYLSLDQAIADVIYFIKYVKTNLNLQNSKVVVVGGSYSASMATWLRLKYPNVIDAAYASSAPVLAVADFYEYHEVINDNIELISAQCLQTIKEGIAQLEEKLETEEGVDEMTDLFKTCNRLQNVDPHRAFFFYFGIAEMFAGLVQYAQADSIKNVCDEMENFSGTSVEKLANYIRSEYEDDCIDDYDTFIEQYSATENTNDMWRSWIYQTCTEYGYYQTSSSDNQPFSNTFSLKFFIDMCTDLFGEDFGTEILTAGIKRTNTFYGGQIPEITKVVSVHGSVDPWHPLGILEDLNLLAPAIFVRGTSHCADLNSESETDSEELRNAKQRVRDLIAQWIM